MKSAAGRRRRLRRLGMILIIGGAACASPAGPDAVGRLVSRTDCKSSGAASAGAAAAPTSGEECVEYDYDGSRFLRLKHVNAGFNCCPGTVSADIDCSGGTVRIAERESSSLCDCSCLYDLVYEIAPLRPGRYRIVVVGPYQTESDPPLAFEVDLVGPASGTFCVPRAHYPWDF